jgi:hypothetical protein
MRINNKIMTLSGTQFCGNILPYFKPGQGLALVFVKPRKDKGISVFKKPY